MVDIRYSGCMTDKLPSWAFTIVVSYGLNPKQYTKAYDYLKENYYRRKVKIDSVEIISIKETENIDGIERGTTLVTSVGSPSTFYKYKVRTYVEVAGDYFTVIQEGLLHVSEMVGQVLSNNMKWIDNNGKVVVRV